MRQGGRTGRGAQGGWSQGPSPHFIAHTLWGVCIAPDICVLYRHKLKLWPSRGCLSSISHAFRYKRRGRRNGMWNHKRWGEGIEDNLDKPVPVPVPVPVQMFRTCLDVVPLAQLKLRSKKEKKIVPGPARMPAGMGTLPVLKLRLRKKKDVKVQKHL